MGAKAGNLLAGRNCWGKVLAVLSTAVYLLGDDGEIIWIVLEERPLHRRCLLASIQPRSLRVGQSFFVEKGCLRIGLEAAIELDRAVLWEALAVEPEQAESLPVVNNSLQRLLVVLPKPSEDAGLGQTIPLISAVAEGRNPMAFRLDSMLARALSPVLDLARASLGQDMAGVARKGRQLVGLGPGLTPSGDDFLGGLLFAAHSLKTAYPYDFNWRDEIVRDLIEWARTQTHPISHAVLNDLALGHGPEPLHDVIRSLLTGQNLQFLMPAVTRLLGIGHTSGWDMLAGMLTGMLLVKGRMTPGSLVPE
jgi:hypothetical protein